MPLLKRHPQKLQKGLSKMALVTSKTKAEFDRKELAKRAGEKESPLLSHINKFKEKFESSEPQQTRYKRDNKPIENMNHVELKDKTADHDEIFKHLKSMGYKKTSGYDPEPEKFTSNYNRDEMTVTTDPLHHPDGVHAHLEQEFNKSPKIHFFHSK